MNRVRIAVVGFGYWNHYARLISEHKDAELVVVCDLKKENLDKVREKYPNVITTVNFKEIYKDNFCDAVVIATPPSTHFYIGKHFIQSEINVLIEKPLTLCSDESELLIQFAKEHNVKLMCGQTFIYNSLVREIKKYIVNGELGQLKYIYAQRTGKSPKRFDCNSTVDLSTHDISMLIYWLNESPIEVQSFGQSYSGDGIEDVTFTNLRFQNNVIANLHASWTDHVKQRKVTIIGTEKMVVFDDIAQILTIYDNEGNMTIPKIKYEEPLKAELDDFISSIINNHEPFVTGEQGLAVVKVLEAAQQSLKNNNN